MRRFAGCARALCSTGGVFVVTLGAIAQHKPLTRHFVASACERYQVTLNLKAESHSVTTETVAAQTYVTPIAHAAEVNLRWRTARRVLFAEAYGTAEIEETLTPIGQQCEGTVPSAESTDAALQASLKDFCSFWSSHETMRYFESNQGTLRDASGIALPQLGEAAPQLLALWLSRAVRPSVVLPALKFEIGTKVQRSFQPASNLLKNAYGSETIEWLEADGETPAVTLHVVQQLSWNSAPSPPGSSVAITHSSLQKDDSFFADSLSTLALEDGSVVRASRTASRTTARHIEPVAGLPQAPDFSSRLAVSVTIERLP